MPGPNPQKPRQLAVSASSLKRGEQATESQTAGCGKVEGMPLTGMIICFSRSTVENASREALNRNRTRMRLVEFTTSDNEKVTMDADRVVAVESYHPPDGSAISGTVVYLIATDNAFMVAEPYDAVKKKVFISG